MKSKAAKPKPTQLKHMGDSLQAVAAAAQKRASEIIAKTGDVRATFAAGRPNSSTESTLEGTLEAFEEIMRLLPKNRQ